MNETGSERGAPATERVPVIEAEALAIGMAQSPDAIVVERIDARIGAGDYWVVGGPAGSGKSDLLATMAGMQRPARGRLRFFGTNVNEAGDEELLQARRRIGLVFENGGRLFNHLTVAENVALPLRYHCNLSADETQETVEEMLSFTGLTSLAHLTPGRIKLPARQRIALARALALKPEVLLLDNPLAGLGPQETGWWLEFLARLSRGGEWAEGKPVSLVVTCHDLRPWTEQARQFALLKRKQWLFVGGRAELACSGEPLLRELLAADFRTG